MRIRSCGSRSVVAAGALTCGLCSGAFADTIAEVPDAGDLPSSAQIVSSTALSRTITGTIGTIAPETGADMFRVYINAGPFTATTVGTPGSLADTQLFLFDSAGMGLLANDDAPGGGTTRSTLTGSIGSSGFYYLAISGYNRDPGNGSGLIFPTTPFTGLFGPTGPGGGSAITLWSGSGATGTYSIELTMVPLPPAAWAGFGGLGCAMGMTAIRRRRLK